MSVGISPYPHIQLLQINELTTVCPLHTDRVLTETHSGCTSGAQDADDEFFLATSPSVASMTGAYYVGSRLHGMNSLAKDPDARQRLWDIMTLDTGAKYS